MTTLHLRSTGAAIERVLTPHQLTMARELMQAEGSLACEPEPRRLLYWLRLNMPGAAARVEALLEPRPLVL